MFLKRVLSHVAHLILFRISFLFFLYNQDIFILMVLISVKVIMEEESFIDQQL